MLLIVLLCIQQKFIKHLLGVGLLFVLSRSWQISTAHLNPDLLRADFGRGCFRDSPTVAIFAGFPLLPPLSAWAYSPWCWPREKPFTEVSCLTAPLLVSSAWLLSSPWLCRCWFYEEHGQWTSINLTRREVFTSDRSCLVPGSTGFSCEDPNNCPVASYTFLSYFSNSFRIKVINV